MRKLKLSELKKMKKEILGQMARQNSFSPNHQKHLTHVFSFGRVTFIETTKKIQMIYTTRKNKIYKSGVSS